MDPLESHLRRQIEHSRDFFWHRVRWDVVSSYLPREEPVRIVDVGAGIGLLGEFLARDFPGARYRFVEPIPFLVEHLEQQFGAEANANDASAFAGDDFVALLDVLEHQEDDHAFLGELAEKMEPGATLLLTVPAMQGLWSTWDEALGHFRRYDRAVLARAVAGLPLTVKESSFLFPEMLLPALARRKRPVTGDAEFPDLPKSVNEVLYRVSSATAARRARWSRGTSLLAVIERQ